MERHPPSHAHNVKAVSGRAQNALFDTADLDACSWRWQVTDLEDSARRRLEGASGVRKREPQVQTLALFLLMLLTLLFRHQERWFREEGRKAGGTDGWGDVTRHSHCLIVAIQGRSGMIQD